MLLRDPPNPTPPHNLRISLARRARASAGARVFSSGHFHSFPICDDHRAKRRVIWLLAVRRSMTVITSVGVPNEPAGASLSTNRRAILKSFVLHFSSLELSNPRGVFGCRFTARIGSTAEAENSSVPI